MTNTDKKTTQLDPRLREDDMVARPPVVVVMGHVDHGKTTLLDYIRKANLASKEAGGITQAVGAYEIEVAAPPVAGSRPQEPRKITFIDTPGHQAFAKMRSRGTAIADIAILVVAADDGVNAQTKEAIEIIQKSGLPFVVAINKIDKANANIEKTKSDLAVAEVLLEGFGGSVSFQPISALTGEGVDALLDLVLLTAEVEEFTYDPNGPVEAYVLEAKKDPFSGVSVTAIVKNGTLRVKDEVQTTSTAGKIKGLKDFMGKSVKSATASSPVVISGFNDLPQVGEKIVDLTVEVARPEVATASGERAEVAENRINAIVKASDGGSLEAIVDALLKIKHPDEERGLSILHQGVGDITDGDAQLAVSTDSYLIGFKVKANVAANNVIRDRGLKVFQSDIIYKILEEVEEEFSGHKQQMVESELDILAVFDQTNHGAQVIGGKVVTGELKEQRDVEVQRRGEKIGTGRITNLQCDKKEVNSVEAENECGVLFSSQMVVKKGDHLIQRPE